MGKITNTKVQFGFYRQTSPVLKPHEQRHKLIVPGPPRLHQTDVNYIMHDWAAFYLCGLPSE